jgi:hypothetical protein
MDEERTAMFLSEFVDVHMQSLDGKSAAGIVVSFSPVARHTRLAFFKLFLVWFVRAVLPAIECAASNKKQPGVKVRDYDTHDEALSFSDRNVEHALAALDGISPKTYGSMYQEFLFRWARV